MSSFVSFFPFEVAPLYIPAQTVRIAYYDLPAQESGKDLCPHERPIVLIHGFASSMAVNWAGPGWLSYLHARRWRIIGLDLRGHSASEKLYSPDLYDPKLMAEDVLSIIDYLGISSVDVMGYSLGGRIAAHLAYHHPERIGRMILGGIGEYLIEGRESSPDLIAEAMQATDLNHLKHPLQRLFRRFAEQNVNDLLALAACIKGSRRGLSLSALSQLKMPILICVGNRDIIAGDPRPLLEVLPQAELHYIPDRDHNTSVGDKTYKQVVQDFLK